MLSSFFESDSVTKALEILKTEIPLAVWETFYVTVLSTLFAIILGLPLGEFCSWQEKTGRYLRYLNRCFMF